MSLNISFESQVPLNNRGLNYGDGFFETLLFEQGSCPLIKYHLARLVNTSHRLGMNISQAEACELSERVINYVRTIFKEREEQDWVIKFLITRASGGRGYRSLPNAEAEVFVQVFPYKPSISEEVLESGVRLRVCDIRLACQPFLAGLKHLNRLENVIARNEWRDERIFEGLLLDQNGLVIEATQSNVFILMGDRWLTPVLNQSGVAGVMRQWLFDHCDDLNVSVHETTLSLDDFNKAKAAFICNSVTGIVPVQSVLLADYRPAVYTENKYFDVAPSYELSRKVRQFLV